MVVFQIKVSFFKLNFNYDNVIIQNHKKSNVEF